MRFPFFLSLKGDRALSKAAAVQGVLAGAATAGLLTTLFLSAGAFPMNLHPPLTEWPGAALTAMGLFVWVDVVASICWAIAIAIVAAPQWAILNALGVRHWVAAVLLGATLAPAPFFLIGGTQFVSLTCLSITGAVAGLVVWLIAYREPARVEGAVRA